MLSGLAEVTSILAKTSFDSALSELKIKTLQVILFQLFFDTHSTPSSVQNPFSCRSRSH